MKDLKGLFCIPPGGKTGVTNKSQSYFASNLMGKVPKSPVPEKNPPGYHHSHCLELNLFETMILAFVQRFLGLPQGKHCKLLEGNMWLKIFRCPKKQFWREIDAFLLHSKILK